MAKVLCKYFLYINSKTDKAASYVLHRYNFNCFTLAERLQIHLYEKQETEKTDNFLNNKSLPFQQWLWADVKDINQSKLYPAI